MSSRPQCERKVKRVTTNALVKWFVQALRDDIPLVELLTTFEPYHPKVVQYDEDVTVWSLALNDDTRDVRFVKVDGGSGFIGEVFPVTKMHTEYEEA